MALPPPSQRPWLLEQLGVLVHQHGHARWLHEPLVEDPSLDGEALLNHAGVRELPPGLAHARTGGHHGALAVDVARAFRIQHRMVSDDEQLEALLAELTATYLGFGLLVLRPPTRQREVRGLVLQTKAPTALESEAIAFLVGAQLAARDPSERQLHRMLGTLPAARGALVLEARAYFRGPGKASLGPLLGLGEPTGRLVEMRTGRPVRKTNARYTLPGAVLGAVFGVALGLIGLAAFGATATFALAAPTALAGGILGWCLRGTRCSNCHTALSDGDILCTGCGGLVTD